MHKRGLLTGVMLLLLFCLSAEAQVHINEVMLSTAVYEGGKAYEWVELYNDGGDASLNGMILAYERNNETQAYNFPSATLKAGQYAVVYLTGNESVPSENDKYYAPFDVSKKGGVISLYASDGSKEDTLELGAQYGDISFGRVNNEEIYQYLGGATRGAKNAPDGYDKRTTAVSFSVPGGFYQDMPEVEALCEEGAVVRYTADGSTPTESSPVWTGEMLINQGVTVIRARAYKEGQLPSEVKAQTYFVGVSRSVPVVSLSTDDMYLTDSKTGILVKGNGKTANYYKDWEYPINVEYYNAENKQEINQMATFRVTGATSRAYAQKAISIFARSALGDKLFYFNPFDNREDYEGYKALTLRAGGTESYKTRFKDAMLTRLGSGMGIFYQESVTCVVYLNGEYYGQYNLRERINKDSLAAYEGITDDRTIDNVTIIKGRDEVQKGTIDEWNELIKYFKKNSMKQQENLDYVLERFDVDSYFTMVAFQIITGNGDIGNQRFYKFPGGKWKYVLYDLDAAMQNTKRTPMGYFFKSLTAKSTLFYHEPFAALIKNEEMQDKFLTICGNILAEKFVWSDLSQQIDAWVETLTPLMEEQIRRWPKSSPKDVGNWTYEVNAFRKIARTRPKTVVTNLVNQFKLTKDEKQQYFGAYLDTLN